MEDFDLTLVASEYGVLVFLAMPRLMFWTGPWVMVMLLTNSSVVAFTASMRLIMSFRSILEDFQIFRFIRLNSMFLWESHNITQLSFQSFFFSISECWYIFLVLIQSEFTDLSTISKHKLEIYPRCMPMKHEPIVKHSNRFCIIWM